jgi:hypothetical protein
LLAELDKFSKAPMGPDDTFILYFAGHGFARDEASYLLTVDSNPGSSNLLRQTAVALETVQEFLSEVRAGQQLLILDACRNEPLAHARGTTTSCMDAVMARDIIALAQKGTDSNRREECPLRARAILSACNEGQASYEYPKGRQGWFSHNLLSVLREHAGEDIDISELSARVGKRMKNRAWQELQQAGDQEPYLQFQGRQPLRLRMRPLSPAVLPIASSADPARVEIKEISVAPLEVEIERIHTAQVTIPGVPPIPGEILELEGVLAGLEQAILALKDQTHPSLRTAQAAIREGQEQWDRLKEDLQSHEIQLSSERKNLLSAEVSRDPAGSLARLCAMVPELLPNALLPYIHRLRNAELARRSVESARKQYEEARARKIAQFETEAEEVHTNLRTRQEEDLQAVLRDFLANAAEAGEFPLEAWLQFEPFLLRRRYAFNPVQLLEKAEHCLQWWESERGRILAEARQELAEHEYTEVRQLLQQLPAPFQSEEVRSLIDEANRAIALLVAEIRQAVADKRYEGLLAKVNRYRKVRPGDAKATKLAEQLGTWEAAQRREEKERQEAARQAARQAEEQRERDRREKWLRALPVNLTNEIGMKLVLIPPGEFLMGSPDSDEDAKFPSVPIIDETTASWLLL